ncbi:glycosyltransferase [Gluconobacter wancherniae]|uniref:glycosyltransferase n=1 Tax=Gluconobacter wancherniae TaxID=1307955 RepID=UPI001B8D63C4|nr:glycosyltransferase [Gluconobacter wancherniae]MBS1063378.1 glycosyltransferase [Gluconobacter wancherniae]
MLFPAAILSLLTWLYLVFFHGSFWRDGPLLKTGPRPPVWPDVAIIVPARDEAEAIQPCLTSLLEQDYEGKLSIILVDDESEDGTGDLARALPDPHGRLTVLTGKKRVEGWSGKLWAVHQGEREAHKRIASDGYVLLTDGDIIHAPTHLTTLVAKAQADNLDMVSEMVALNCESSAERSLVPAFVYFFAMLYPFRKVADEYSKVAGAAGGTILLRRNKLIEIGGIESLRGALIDDCTLAAHVKKSGGKLYLGHSTLAWSVRPYRGAAEIWRMIARTAYVQLHHSPLALLGTLLGMGLIWLLPVGLTLFGTGRARKIGFLTYAVSCITFIPTLRRFQLPLWRALPLPLIAGFYMAATVGSAIDHHRGVGVRWKDRSYTDEAS